MKRATTPAVTKNRMVCPMPDDFTDAELARAVRLYAYFKNRKVSDRQITREIRDRMGCIHEKATMLKAAAAFHYRLKQKGLA